MAHIGMTLCDPGGYDTGSQSGVILCLEMSGVMAGANVEYYAIREENG